VTLSRARTVALLEEAGLVPKRKFGQNFVVDPNITAKIARLAAIEPGQRVLEIGPGLGSLTEALLAEGALVRAVEVDPGLVELLRSRPELAEVEFVEADALEVDLDQAAPANEGTWSVVANLPYNVATPLVLRLLEEAPQVARLLVMVQAEVGERMAASPRSKEFGAVSLRVAYHARARVVAQIPPTVFYPRPKVDSVLVAIERREHPAVDPAVATEEEIFTLVAASFAQRRKMLRRSLAALLQPADFEEAQVAPTARPEELGLEQFAALAQARRR
jgi:16S rRNA (adenine1518-N6/adenine1519-N6)-dimethyltransferase